MMTTFDPESAYMAGGAPVHPPRLPEQDPQGAGVPGLTSEEADQFRKYGFVIKRGLLSPDQFQPFIDLLWQQPPITAAGVKMDNPASWVSPGRQWPTENRWALADDWMGEGHWPSLEEIRPGASVGERVGRLPHKLTKDISNDVWRWHGIGHDPAFVDATSAHPAMLNMVETLLGSTVKRTRRNRGIYSIFPHDKTGPESKLGPHMDQNMTELMAVTYLDEVGSRGGGFTIYPGSPQLLYPTSEQALNWIPTDRSRVAMDWIVANIEPLEFANRKNKPKNTIRCQVFPTTC